MRITPALLLLLLSCWMVRAADQPQWGQAWSRNMVSHEKGLPDSFDPANGRNVKWSARLGSQTHSTPIVAGGRVYIGTNNEEPRDPRQRGDRGVLMCFEEFHSRWCPWGSCERFHPDKGHRCRWPCLPHPNTLPRPDC